MHQWVRPRSLMLHLAFVLIAGGCLVAGWWQVHRAMQGNTLSYLYSVEWPAFAVVAGIGWWQMVHDTPGDIAERRAFHDRMRAASREVVARTLPRSALAITVDSQVLEGRQLEEGSAGPELTEGGEASQETALERAGPVPARSAAEAALLATEEEGDQGDEMAVYNRYLAMLAVHGKAKTWRNPHGV